MTNEEVLVERHCGFCGKERHNHLSACMPEPYGPSGDWGDQDCHGCERGSDRWGDPTVPDQHDFDCPGSCQRLFCLPHGRLDLIGQLRHERRQLQEVLKKEELPYRETAENNLKFVTIDLRQMLYNNEFKPYVYHCGLCQDPAVWMRQTQFSGKHFFCSLHAVREEDFGKADPGYYGWKKVDPLRK